MVQIAEQLGRSLGSIDGRMQRLRARSKSEPAPVSSGKSWSASEDKILMEKFKAGLNMEQVLSFFPGRSIKSARGRYYKLKMGGAGVPRKASDRKRWTVEEKRRVISMILVDGLSQRVIAERLGRTRQAVRSVWLKHGRKVLPADMIEKYRGEQVDV